LSSAIRLDRLPVAAPRCSVRRRQPSTAGTGGGAMAGLLMILTVLGLWFVISALFDWEWAFGVIDFQDAELGLGVEAVRWTFCACGVGMVILGVVGLMLGR